MSSTHFTDGYIRAGGDEAAAGRWIDDMGTKNRYVLDVWAGG